MVKDHKVLAIVPARGGSKSIPGKNIREFAGYPLIAYSIAAGLQAECVQRTIVSTDDEGIAGIAGSFDAEVPFLRPAELAGDNTPDFPVIEHALEWLAEQENYQPDIVVQLRPTSPVRPPDCVDRAVNDLLSDEEADSVRGVVPSGQNPYKMWTINAAGRLSALMTGEYVEPYNMPRQDLPQTFWQTGHIDAIRVKTIRSKGSLTGEIIKPLLLDPRYAVDIDTERDWENAERLIQTFELPYVQPGRLRRPFPTDVAMVVLDFDGVLTDDRVWVDAKGRELVAAHRGDGLGIARLKGAGVEIVVLSSETDPVVTTRCRKLGIEAIQGLKDKTGALKSLLRERKLDAETVVYVGNDVNDAPCFELVGCAIVPADAHIDVKQLADIHLTKPGGRGAVRELCDMVLNQRRQ